MIILNNYARIFGIIFVAGVDGVTQAQIATALALPLEEVAQILQEIQLDLQHQVKSPIELVVYSQSYRFVTKAELTADIEQFAQSPFSQKLSKAAIETLAIIAYRQPITRIAIDEIRGVSSAALIHKLQTRDLIKEVGRVEAPGRPVLYGVTTYFMDYFGLKSLADLPEISQLDLNEEVVTENLFAHKDWQIRLFDDEYLVE